MFRFPDKWKKKLVLLATVIFVLVDLFGALAFVRPVRANLPVTDAPALTQRTAIVVKEEVEFDLWQLLTMAGMGALLEGTSYFVRKVAYDTADYLTKGDWGKGKGFWNTPPKEHFGKELGTAVTDILKDSLASGVSELGGQLGLNLCQIPNPKVNIFLELGIRDIFGADGPQPKCSFQKFWRDNWGRAGDVLRERYGPGGEKFLAETFNAQVKVKDSDFGVALDTIAQVDNAQAKVELSLPIERMVGEGLKDVKSLISGQILTPAAVLREEIESVTAKENTRYSVEQLAGVYASELPNLPAYAASIFLTTLVSKLFNKIASGELFGGDDEPEAGREAGQAGSFFASTIRDNRRAAERALSFLITPTIRQLATYDIVIEFAACPDSPGLNNCVIDTSLQTAINRAKQTAGPLTIKKALEEGLLHSNWPLISARREADNQDLNNCYLKGYCYSNLQKLRKARILPLGFEVAALKSDPDQPWTLGQVVNGFNDCNSSTKQADAKYPFCHLIDPNWVLKAPPARCQTKVVGPELIAKDAATRREECVDLQTCVLEDDNGTCQAWGYCTREKNVWRLPGQVCPAHYATCTTYNNKANNAEVSYLARTVDFGECGEKSAGCRAYSTEQDASGKWITPTRVEVVLKSFGRPQVLHFNKNVKSCSGSAEGCTAFYAAKRDTNGQFALVSNQYQKDTSKVAHLKRAPDYLGCYDISPTTPVIDWPQTRVQALNNLPKTPACQNFAQACAPSEVGCEEYTPAGGSQKVPAIAGRANVCDQSCVGYETFKQEASAFEAEKFPLYFIPRLGEERMADGKLVCDRETAGCDEFTNLEAAAAGGERLAYFSRIRYCEKPSGSNEKTFFSWQGSDREGYVLRTHRLLQIDSQEFIHIQALADIQLQNKLTFSGRDNVATVFPEGSPAYNDDTLGSLQQKYRACNAANYGIAINNPNDSRAADADCRALYDNRGNIYYRRLSDTVTVSPECTRFRKTDSRLQEDQALTSAGMVVCQRQGGLWRDITPADSRTNPVCQRCFAGGRYDNGACIYQTIPAQATQCPAASNGCRQYTGNAGNNLRPSVIEDQFNGEPGKTLEPWTKHAQVKLSAEAIRVGDKSLQVDLGVVERVIPVGTVKDSAGNDISLRRNYWYELSFWARGTPQALTVTFAQDPDGSGSEPVAEIGKAFNFNPATNQNRPVVVGGDWQEYRLGPIQFVGDPRQPVLLRFRRQTTTPLVPPGSYFLDVLRLGELEQPVYLIKNSWQRTVTYQGREIAVDAPLACFAASQTPNGPFPGVALGCRKYQDSQNNTSYLTGFASLCRVEAVGCQPVFESHNTVNRSEATAYNLWCQTTGQPASRPDTCELKSTVPGSSQTFGRCTILVGQTGCYIQEAKFGSLGFVFSDIPPGAIVASTIFIPAETNRPIFLTNRNATGQPAACRETEQGCIKVGLQDQVLPVGAGGAAGRSYRYSDVYILNDPAQYGTTLCREDQLGCGEFTAGANTYYFKDPQRAGQATCSYQSEKRIGGQLYSGWFKDGIGTCSNSPVGGALLLCRGDGDCGAGNKCLGMGETPCYANLLQAGNVYGIWSNQSGVNYKGLTGRCPASENACTEFVDPTDTSIKYPKGQPYYRIFGQQSDLRSRVRECESRVSRREGCVLFDRTDQPNKLWQSASTYDQSQRSDLAYGLVAPLSARQGSKNDANIILKVDRDRDCSEWLACRNEILQTDKKGSKLRLCSQYKACREAAPNSGDKCVDFVDPPLNDSFLDEPKYTGRDVSWFGADYAGYSLFNKYQITDYVYLTFPGASTDQHLAYRMNSAFFAPGQPSGTSYEQLGCRSLRLTIPPKLDGAACGFDNKGRCYNSECLYPIEGPGQKSFPKPTSESKVDVENIHKTITASSCKGFPETDSPFPWENLAERVGTPKTLNATSDPKNKQRFKFSEKNQEFRGANLCQEGQCACEYKKYTYGGGGVDYWPMSTTLPNMIPDGVCQGGGEKEGAPCKFDANCVQSAPEIKGTCSPQKSIETLIGLKGFCLEPDLSHPVNGAAKPGIQQEYACLTWLPIQTSAARVDLFNSFQEAGYLPTSKYDGPATGAGGQLYCSAMDRGGWYEANNFPSSFARYSFQQTAVDLMYGRVFHPPSMFTYTFCPEHVPQTEISRSNLQPSRDFLISNVYADRLYRRAMCTHISWRGQPSQPIPRTQMAYQMMQVWAWKHIGPTALVLHLDEPNYTSSYLNGLDHRSIDKIYIVPIKQYSDGSNNYLPQLLSDEYVMDVDRLRQLGGDQGLAASPVRYSVDARSTTTIKNFIIRDNDGLIYQACPVNRQIVNQFVNNLNDGCWGNTNYNQMLQWTYVKRSGLPPGIAIRYGWLFGTDANGEVTYSSSRVTFRPSSIFPTPTNPNGFATPPPGDEFAPNTQCEAGLEGVALDVASDGSITINRRESCSDSTGLTKFAVIAKLKNQCIEYISVFKDDVNILSENTNKAWTNRTWKNARDPSDNSKRLRHPKRKYGYSGTDLVFTQDTAIRPFGSVPLSASAIADDTALRTHYFSKANLDGLPYSCQDAIPNLSQANLGSTAPSPVCPFIDASYSPVFSAAIRGLVSPYNEGVSDARAVARDAIYELFAKFWNVKRMDGSRTSYVSVISPAVVGDKSGDSIFLQTAVLEGPGTVVINEPPPITPQTYSLNPATCFIQGQTTGCVAGDQDNMTVNQRNGTMKNYDRDPLNTSDEDRNRDGDPDFFIEHNTFTADLRFFALADDNRMPIRRVSVDWGGGDPSSRYTNDGITGLYKNHKPLCSADPNDTDPKPTVGLCNSVDASGNASPTQLTCAKDEDCPAELFSNPSVGLKRCLAPSDLGTRSDTFAVPRFGNAQRACTPDYFQFNHTYSCSQKDLIDTTATWVRPVSDSIFSPQTQARLKGHGLSDNDLVCLFRPRVQVLDNWGYCNGRCVDSTPGNAGNACYDAGPDKKNECNIKSPIESDHKPYTEYKGMIIVIPRKQ